MAELNARYMPADVWVDVWDSGCPNDGGSAPPCLPMYTAFENTTRSTASGAGAVGGFSQWCTGCNGTSSPHFAYNDWLDDGTPVFLQPAALWYPDEKGFCNKTDGSHGKRPSEASLAIEFDCIEHHLRTVAATNPARPLFVPAYGVTNYVDVAAEMRTRLGPAGFEVVGAQDFAVLGRAAAP